MPAAIFSYKMATFNKTIQTGKSFNIKNIQYTESNFSYKSVNFKFGNLSFKIHSKEKYSFQFHFLQKSMSNLNTDNIIFHAEK